MKITKDLGQIKQIKVGQQRQKMGTIITMTMMIQVVALVKKFIFLMETRSNLN